MSNNIDWDAITAIKWALIDDGWTQRQLADTLGWDEPHLSKILTRKQPLLVKDLERIAEIQGRDYGWYLGEPRVNRAKGVYVSSLVPAAA